jgi:hypothetical protein
MKLIFCSLLFFFLSACKKELTTSEKLIGTWELKTEYGGFSSTITHFPPGNGNLIEFGNNFYKKYQNGQVYESGSYTIKDTVWQQLHGSALGFGSSPIYYFIQIKNSVLSMTFMVIDGGGSDYRRIN